MLWPRERWVPERQTLRMLRHAVTRAWLLFGKSRDAPCQPMSPSECIAMILSANLGFPRIGSRRELKQALESFWSGATGADALVRTAQALRARHWFVQQKAGISH